MFPLRSGKIEKTTRAMAEEKDTITAEPAPQLKPVNINDKKIYVGLVGNYPESEETRFLLTPEACGLLTSGGIYVCMESGAGVDIDFSDEKYAEYGVEIVDRDKALSQNTVLSYSPLKNEDILKMKDGATLLCMMDSTLFNPGAIKSLLEKKITLGCLNNMLSYNEDPVFANIVDDIDGRAAILYAQESLSYLGGGKGVLLGGVSGVNPCEVLLIGEGAEILAAANAAIERGAIVTLMNNDISALHVARQVCGKHLLTLAIHPRVLFNKIKTADVILMGNTTRPFELPKKLTMAMKNSAFVLDFKESHPSVCVPRTVAMALSNVMVNFLNDMALMEGFKPMMATTEGVQRGIITYQGKLVNKLIATYLGMPSVDISVMLAHSN